jgi:TRAP-type C4-dicarboxylate transport system permease small subunit
MLADALPPSLKKLSEALITFLVIAVSAIFLAYSLSFWQSGLTITASSVPVKLAVFYSCIPFMFAALILVGIERLLLQSLPEQSSQQGAA